MTELLRRCRVCGGKVGSCTDGVLFALGCMECGRRTELVYRRSDAEREWQKMNEPEVVKRYPTWNEWLRLNGDYEIPAEIAEKLGIIPKEVEV